MVAQLIEQPALSPTSIGEIEIWASSILFSFTEQKKIALEISLNIIPLEEV
jgi:hypothetical protein